MPLRGKGEANRTRVELSTPGEWVDIKTRLSRGDQLELQSRLMAGIKLRNEVEAMKGLPDLDTLGSAEAAARLVDLSGIDLNKAIADIEFAKFEVGVIDWSFAHGAEPVELTAENIRELDEVDVEIISAKMAEMYERSDDARQD